MAVGAAVAKGPHEPCVQIVSSFKSLVASETLMPTSQLQRATLQAECESKGPV